MGGRGGGGAGEPGRRGADGSCRSAAASFTPFVQTGRIFFPLFFLLIHFILFQQPFLQRIVQNKIFSYAVL